MSLCAVDLQWADDTHRFALPLAQLEELQERCDAGPLLIFQRLQTGQWRTSDVYHTLRLGLVGGGMTPVAALKLVQRYVVDRNWLENAVAAAAIIAAVLHGKLDEPLSPGKATAEGPEVVPTADRKSTSGTSTASAP